MKHIGFISPTVLSRVTLGRERIPFSSNLKYSSEGCSVCAAPVPITCETKLPACINGKCVAADPA